MALLLPAIQRVREASNRVRCGNNLRQLALAAHTFHNEWRSFPYGGSNACSGNTPIDVNTPASFCQPDANGNVPGCCRPYPHTQPEMRFEWSWTYHILPYMEFDALYQSTNPTQVEATIIPIFYCPTRRLPKPPPRSDYAGNVGTTSSNSNDNGIFVYNQRPFRISIDMIFDGSSNTILIGEKQVSFRYMATSGYCCDDNESPFVPGWDADVLRFGNAALGTNQESGPPGHDQQHPADVNNNNGLSSWRFGSRHVLSFNVVLVDHSIRRIRYNCDPTLFQYLCSRNDGQTVTISQLE
ncbi:MAG: DUF1559 domain-containing protein [Gemmatales bacterium]|nr:DUF1559 domain-containing protein [Gemmatales bacterium]MCS7159675.1 DUF1559 domain-containing protein [Gemmatales bacterium]